MECSGTMLNKQKIKNIFSKFHNCNILLLGDLMVDVEIIGSVNRISQEAPVIIVNEENKIFKLGGSANIISNIVSLGGNVCPCGIVGNDNNGNFIRFEINKLCKLNNLLVDNSRPTVTKTRIFSKHQQIFRIDKESKKSIKKCFKDSICKFINNHIHDFSGIIISDYNKGLLDGNLTREIIDICYNNNKTIFTDPKCGYYRYTNSNFITPNLNELSWMSGIEINNDDDIYRAGDKLYHDLKLEGLIITRGEGGISIIRNNGSKMITIPTKAREVSNVVGAGDTVIATFALAYLSGLSMEEAAEVANLAAGVVVGKVGTAMATPDEILRMI